MRLTGRLSFAAIQKAIGYIGPGTAPVAVAVSGGSDSMALLRMILEVHSGRDSRIVAMTVDHRLRAESRSEADQVAEWCDALNIQHRLLTWEHLEPVRGNLSKAARDARYSLMKAECSRLGIQRLCTGHTLDDQAETVLMRLARGSGVDGLSAIRPSVYSLTGPDPRRGVTLKRPLLDFTREQLRDHLRAIGQDWIDDPTNDDDSYDRIKARKMLAVLEPLGLTKQRLATTARVMGMAREALEVQAGQPRKVWQWTSMGCAETDFLEFLRLPRDIQLRRLADAMNLLTGATYRPRLSALEAVLDRPWEGARTLHGCIIRRGRGKLTVMREPNAVSEPPRLAAAVECWDHRFRIDMDGAPDTALTIAALGEAGLRQIPKDHNGLSRDWLKAYRAAKQTTPGLWDGDTLLSAPLAPWVRDASVPALRVKTLWPE